MRFLRTSFSAVPVLLTVAIASLALSDSGRAAIITIDFETLQHADAGIANHGDAYSESGFLFLEDGSNEFSSWGTSSSRFTGSTSLFTNTGGGRITLAQIGGGDFSLHSIDLAELNGTGASTVVFMGAFTGGGTTSQSFGVDGIFGAETFHFDSSFHSVNSVSWVQASPFHQFDNVVVNNAPVPEPSSWLMFLTLMTICSVFRFCKRRRRLQ